MTRQFRIGLFVALAGMVGLHVRPCLVCVADGGAAPECSAAPEGEAEVVTQTVAAVAVAGPRVRPALHALARERAAKARLASAVR